MLTMQSFITGQLLIELDFFPNTPVVLRNLEKDEIEIPDYPVHFRPVGPSLR